jgi:hypothetical protein
MTREDVEQRVRLRGEPSARAILGCAVRLDPVLTEEFAWGWVAYLVPQEPGDCARRYDRVGFACERGHGRVEVVGTKGLADARRLGVGDLGPQ